MDCRIVRLLLLVVVRGKLGYNVETELRMSRMLLLKLLLVTNLRMMR